MTSLHPFVFIPTFFVSLNSPSPHFKLNTKWPSQLTQAWSTGFPRTWNYSTSHSLTTQRTAIIHTSSQLHNSWWNWESCADLPLLEITCSVIQIFSQNGLFSGDVIFSLQNFLFQNCLLINFDGSLSTTTLLHGHCQHNNNTKHLYSYFHLQSTSQALTN